MKKLTDDRRWTHGGEDRSQYLTLSMQPMFGSGELKILKKAHQNKDQTHTPNNGSNNESTTNHRL